MTTPAIPDDGILSYTQPQYWNLVAPILSAILVSFTLFGASVVQFIDCLDRLRWDTVGDRIIFYYLVVLAAFDVADSIGKGMFIVQYLGMIASGGVFGSQKLPSVAVMIASLDGSIATLNHVAYIYRIVRLTPKRGFIINSILVFSGIVSLVQLASAGYGATWCFIPVVEWRPSLIPWATIWMGGSALADILLCGLFVWCLTRHKSDFKPTNRIIVKYVSLSIETGFIPTAFQLAAMILWLVVIDKPYEISLGCFQSKLYINAILLMVRSTLTTRETAKVSAVSGSSIGGWSRATGATGPAGKGGSGFYGSRSGQREPGVASGIAITTNVQNDVELEDGRYYSDDKLSGRHPYGTAA